MTNKILMKKTYYKELGHLYRAKPKVFCLGICSQLIFHEDEAPSHELVSNFVNQLTYILISYTVILSAKNL